MNKLIICKGPPYSGKTTWSKLYIHQMSTTGDNLWVRVNTDDIKRSLSIYNDNLSTYLKDSVNHQIISSLNAGLNVVYDECNLDIVELDGLLELLNDKVKERFNIEYKLFNLPLSECISRDSQADDPKGEEYLTNFYKTYLSNMVSESFPKAIKHVPFDRNLDNCIICDLDNVLALADGRAPDDFSKCGRDVLNESVANILRTYKDNTTYNGYYGKCEIFLISDRPTEYITETKEWLSKYGIPHDYLILRKKYDIKTRNSFRNKFYFNSIKDNYNTIMWIGDEGPADMVKVLLKLPYFQV